MTKSEETLNICVKHVCTGSWSVVFPGPHRFTSAHISSCLTSSLLQLALLSDWLEAAHTDDTAAGKPRAAHYSGSRGVGRGRVLQMSVKGGLEFTCRGSRTFNTWTPHTWHGSRKRATALICGPAGRMPTPHMCHTITSDTARVRLITSEVDNTRRFHRDTDRDRAIDWQLQRFYLRPPWAEGSAKSWNHIWSVSSWQSRTSESKCDLKPSRSQTSRSESVNRYYTMWHQTLW